jgi:gas vesicle protein
MANLALGLGLGLILGAGAAVFLTPRTGQETRARLGVGARRLKHRTSEAALKLMNRTNEKMEGAREQLSDIASDLGRNDIGSPRSFG